MAIQINHTFHPFQKLATFLIFVCYTSSIMLCSSSSSSSQVENCEESSESINSNIQSFCTSKEYIMQSYFDAYSSLLGSDFQDFVVRKLPSNSCETPQDSLKNFASRVSLLGYNLIGEGSHRHLFTSIRIRARDESVSQQPKSLCKIVIVERLPSGVFADPFELQNLRQRGAFSDVAVFGDTNLELPSFRSNRSVVEIHYEVTPKHQNEFVISINLPLHARYQPLEDSGYGKIEFGDPDLFLCCRSGQKPRDSSCLVLTIGSSQPKTGAVIWEIPAGIRAHTKVVSVVTFATAILSTLSIVVASVYSSDMKPCRNMKKS